MTAGDWARRAADAVAGFTSTRSRGMDAMFGGPGGPTHAARSAGARVWTADGKVLLDWTMSLGAVSLGYAHPDVTAAAVAALENGAVHPLPPTLEVETAEAVCASYPGAEQARFFKTGAEAVAAAVRIARVATGRTAVVHCGYHGWLDGPTGGPGVPREIGALWHQVPFDDSLALSEACERCVPAAIVLEPVVERAPSPAWLQGARAVADRCGAVLVLDEIKTAFRIARGGAAEKWSVRPDLAVLGKALANGLPLAAVVGRADLMARVRETWISSTLATESVALAASRAVLQVWEHMDVHSRLERVGRAVMEGLASSSGARAGLFEVRGIPEMFYLRFSSEEIERRFLLDCAARGLLLKRGPYCFPCLAHTEADVEETIKIAGQAAAELLR